jgi:hypothetical protein
MDSVVGYVPGGGNTVGGFSFGPEPCGSGGPNCAYDRGPARNPMHRKARIGIERRVWVLKVGMLIVGMAARPDKRGG